MKITGTRSYILVEYDHRTLKIEGELTLTPAFYAISNSIKKWEPPYEKDPITVAEKKEIILRILDNNINSKLKVYFELD